MASRLLFSMEATPHSFTLLATGACGEQEHLQASAMTLPAPCPPCPLAEEEVQATTLELYLHYGTTMAVGSVMAMQARLNGPLLQQQTFL